MAVHDRFVVTPSTSMFTKLPAPSTQASATSAVSIALPHLHPVSTAFSRSFPCPSTNV